MKTQFVSTKKSLQLTEKIQKAIDDKGWTLKDLAEAMKVDISTTRRWMSGHHDFQVNVLFALEEKLGIKLINLE